MIFVRLNVQQSNPTVMYRKLTQFTTELKTGHSGDNKPQSQVNIYFKL